MTAELALHLRPTLLGIGAPKAGTTWLAQVLSGHPEIFMPPQKELNALHYGDLSDRLTEYGEYFRAAGSAPVRCDFSVRYMASPRAPAAAARHAPDARVLAVLRDPVDQIQSHYWHLRRQNFHQPEPLSRAPDVFEALERFPDLLLEPALYARHLARWLERFPRDRLLLIDYERLSADQAAVFDEICRFLDISPFDFAPAAQAVGAGEGRGGVQPRSGLAGALFPLLYVHAARGPYQWLKRRLGVRKAEGLKRTLRLRQISERVFFKTGYPRLDDAGRERLRSYVAADLAALPSVTGFRASWTS